MLERLPCNLEWRGYHGRDWRDKNPHYGAACADGWQKAIQPAGRHGQ